ncbi:MAG: extracellular solute-binding protein [Cyanobacteria bacterium P01_C01_bin.121]
MITRRTLLLGTAGLAAGSVLSGCNRSPDLASFDVTLLEGAIPAEVIKQFRQKIEATVQFHPVAQPQQVFQYLQRWQQQPEKRVRGSRFMPWRREKVVPSAHNLVSVSDYWLRSAIAQNLIAPLTLSDDILEPLPYGWQQFATRDGQGQIVASDSSSSVDLWAAPYKVQSLVIVYRQSQVQNLLSEGGSQPFQTWRDLLAPVWQGRIALPDHPNLVIGLLQKIQTGSFNTSFDSLVNSSSPTAQLVAQLNEQLAEPFASLNAQVKTYDADTALKALVNEDVQVVVAWSGDVVTALQRYRDLRAVIPEEGSLLSADMWVRPHDAPMSEAAQQWISFCWGEGAATQLSVSGRGLSPVFLAEDGLSDPSTLPSALAGAFEKAWLSPSALQNSEPLLPLPDAMQAAYVALWQQLRSKGAA